MNKELFLKIFDLYYQITYKKSDLNPDISISVSSIGWSIHIKIWEKGYEKWQSCDKLFILYEDSATEEIEEVIKYLESLL